MVSQEVTTQVFLLVPNAIAEALTVHQNLEKYALRLDAMNNANFASAKENQIC